MEENEYNEYVSWMDGNGADGKLQNVFCEGGKIPKRRLIYLKKINTQFIAVQREHYKAAMFCNENRHEYVGISGNTPYISLIFDYCSKVYRMI